MLEKLFILFMFYSFIGWCMEVILALFELKKFVNRGFLMGPYCPIYGCGCLLLTLLLNKYIDEPFVIFALAILICSVLEYFTSWIMEVIFKMRWWDYSDAKFNINGRICLETIVPFGIGGVIVVRHVNPYMLSLLSNIPNLTLRIILIFLVALFILDLIISSNVIFNLKNVIKTTTKDSTIEIKKYIEKQIKNNLILYNRLLNSFPNLKRIIDKQKVKQEKKKAKEKEKRSKRKIKSKK